MLPPPLVGGVRLTRLTPLLWTALWVSLGGMALLTQPTLLYALLGVPFSLLGRKMVAMRARGL